MGAHEQRNTQAKIKSTNEELAQDPVVQRAYTANKALPWRRSTSVVNRSKDIVRLGNAESETWQMG
eukprot:2518067-Pyramimonas_sp.AAC.1